MPQNENSRTLWIHKWVQLKNLEYTNQRSLKDFTLIFFVDRSILWVRTHKQILVYVWDGVCVCVCVICNQTNHILWALSNVLKTYIYTTRTVTVLLRPKYPAALNFKCIAFFSYSFLAMYRILLAKREIVFFSFFL